MRVAINKLYYMKKVTMSKKSFIKEHVELIKVMKLRSKSGLNREVKEQSKELKKVRKNK
jgi:hypothetical protein